MLRWEVLSAGKRLKKIRKNIRSTQVDIAAGYFTRETISLIENDKMKLIKPTAEILVNNINKIIKDKDIKIPFITIDDLIESETKQIDNIVENYMNELKLIKISDDPKNKLDVKMLEIEDFINNYEVSNEGKCLLYDIAADIYYNNSYWDESKTCYQICRDESLIRENYENVLKYIACLTRVYYRLDNFKEILTIINYGKHIINKYNLMENMYTKIIYYNSALAHSKLEQYDDAINTLNIIINMPGLTRNQMLDLNVQKGSCYLKKKEYDFAESYFKKALKTSIDDGNANITALAYLNLSRVKIEALDIVCAENFADLASEIKATDVLNEAWNTYNLVLVYIMIGKLHKVDKYYKEAIRLSIKVKNVKMQIDLFNKLSEYFITNKYYKHLDSLLLIIKDKVIMGEITSRECIDMYMISAEVFKDINKDKFINIFNDGILLIKHLKNPI